MKPEDRYDSLFQFYAQEHDIVPWQLLKAQVKAESSFDPMARSTVGAIGLAQFMSGTFSEWSTRLHIANPNPYNPEHSVNCQAGYMRWLLDNFQNNVDRALGAYNFGVGNEMQNRPWPIETQNYVKRIKDYLADYVAL